MKPPRRLHLAVLGCLLAWSACLNPRPDDQPLASGNADGNSDTPTGSREDPSIEDPAGGIPNNPADPGLDDGEDPDEPDPDASENPPGNGDGSPAVPTDAGSPLPDASTDAD